MTSGTPIALSKQMSKISVSSDLEWLIGLLLTKINKQRLNTAYIIIFSLSLEWFPLLFCMAFV